VTTVFILIIVLSNIKVETCAAATPSMEKWENGKLWICFGHSVYTGNMAARLLQIIRIYAGMKMKVQL
jgi:hypothetical protein